MPELPEVETVVRSLRTLLVGKKVTDLWFSGKRLRTGSSFDPVLVRAACAGAAIVAVRRRAKYVLVDLKGMQGAAVLLVHLGMSGRLRVVEKGAELEPHTHVVWRLRTGHELRFVDPRRFGDVAVAASDQELRGLLQLGPEPLEIETADLAASLRGSRAPLKSFLLDQAKIAGLGNIYVCEILWRTGLHPAREARSCVAHAAALREATVDILHRAIENRGTTLRDYVDAEGTRGANQFQLAVYGREGEACRRCAKLVKRMVQAGRSTFFCSSCQRRTAAGRVNRV